MIFQQKVKKNFYKINGEEESKIIIPSKRSKNNDK